MHSRNHAINPHSKISVPCIQRSKFEVSPLELRKRSITITVRKKGVLAQKEESGNHQNNRFVTIATDA